MAETNRAHHHNPEGLGFSGHFESKKMAHFGYIKVPEVDKVYWVLKHFNTVAGKYDLMNTLLSGGIHYLWKRTAVNMLKLKTGQLVIDVCGGTGDLALLAASKVGATGRVVLYDINRKMIERGLPKAAFSSVGNRIFYVQGDAEESAFGDQFFDAAIVGFGVRNLTDMERGFREMVRVLKPGGRLVCLEFSVPTATLFRKLYDFYSFYIMPALGKLIVGSKLSYLYLPESIRLFPPPEALRRLLENAGLIGVTYRKLTNGIAVVYVGRKPGMNEEGYL